MIRRLALPVAVGAILLLACILRFSFYGDPRLAVATMDTASYVDSARAPLLSWQAMTGERLFTTNLVFKLTGGGADCSGYPVSMPAIGREIGRAIQPCLSGMALLQALLAVGSWSWLAVAIARHLRAAPVKLLGAALVVFFAFTPQVAAWDSVVGSESLSLSLFALSFGFLIEAVFAQVDESAEPRSRPWLAWVLWLLSVALWLFTKDANLLAVLPMLVLLIPVIARRTQSRKPALVTAVVLAALLIIGLITSAQSGRWRAPLRNAMQTFILPQPARAAYLSQRFDMPDPGSPAYASWFESRGRGGYFAFLLSHPGFIIATVQANGLVFSHSYEQPYYELRGSEAPPLLALLAEPLHPASGAFHIIGAISVVALCGAALIRCQRHTLAWAGILTWLYLSANLMLLVTFFADTDGVMRHIFPSLEMLRLLMWLSILVLIDHLLHTPALPQAPPVSPARPAR